LRRVDQEATIPENTQVPEQRSAAFRVKFWRLYAIEVAWTSAAWVLFWVAWYFVPHSVGWEALVAVALFGIATAVVFLAIVVALHTRRPSVFVGPEGIGVEDIATTLYLAKWSTMRSARVVNFGGLRHLYIPLVTAGGDAPVWIPLFLCDPAGFTEAVMRHAPEGNPAREALQPCAGSPT
jgi:hypothetical protein